MTHILGISAYYHDSAAALIRDGIVVAAAEEERFSRRKHDAEFPSQAVAYCLEEAQITAGQIDYVVFYDKPLLKFDRLLETYLAYAPIGFRSFIKALPLWLHQKLHLSAEIRRELKGDYNKRIIFTEHHESHAASAFFPSPFEEAAIVTLDGVGEWATTSMGVGRGSEIEMTQELRFPHSLGLLYSAFTYFCGFKVNSGEYKLMGLAPYGEPKYEQIIREHLIDLREDGSFRLNMEYFNYCQGLTMTNERFARLFGGLARAPETELTQREMDIAASIQRVTEDVMLRICRTARKQTGMRNLCLAGGVALNCVGNGRILRESGFESVWIQPAAGDAGGAIGAALLTWHQLLKNSRQPQQPDGQLGSLLGPAYEQNEITRTLENEGAFHSGPLEFDVLLDKVVTMLDQGQVVGWFQGRMEFGPRALGNRSILGDPRNPDMQSRINQRIKFRESFRPFAACVLEEEANNWFEISSGHDSPYMLIVTDVQEHRRKNPSKGAEGFDKLKEVRSEIPAVTHVDHSCRIQTVDRTRNPRLRQLLERFHAATGCPALINTSMNVRGEPIVCTPEEAFHCFMHTDMDALVLGDFLLLKTDQKKQPVKARTNHVAD